MLNWRGRQEARDAAGATPARRPWRLDLVVVTGGGARVRRLGVRRSAIGASLLLLALALLSFGALLDDYLAMRAERAELLAVAPRLHEHEARLAVYRARLRELNAELQGWRAVRDRIWAAFGPDVGLGAPAGGIGGVSAPLPRGEAARDAAAARASGGSLTDGAQAIRDELERLTAVVAEEGEGLRSLQQFLARASSVLAAAPSRWPARGPVNSEFGRRTWPWNAGSEDHGGIDIGVPAGTPVHAPAPGVVAFASRLGEYGIAVIIDHGNDIQSVYGHLSRLGVAERQSVQRGDLIAWSGNTGRSSGPHLHYEIRVGGRPVNPRSFLWE